MVKYNDVLEKEGVLRYNLFFEKIYGYIIYIAKYDNKLYVISRQGISIWNIINDVFYFDYFISIKHKKYNEIERWIKNDCFK